MWSSVTLYLGPGDETPEVRWNEKRTHLVIEVLGADVWLPPHTALALAARMVAEVESPEAFLDQLHALADQVKHKRLFARDEDPDGPAGDPGPDVPF